MAFNCPNCKARVFDHSALCDDRNDPAKEFGCPNCGSFYFLREPYKNRYKHKAKDLFFFGTGVAVSQFFDLKSYFQLILWAGIAAFVVYPGSHLMGTIKLKPSPYRSPHFDYDRDSGIGNSPIH